jgi:UDP-GlcNAc3NAcA epimerase
MKIVTVVGARPQFIKAAIVSIEIKKHAEIEEVIVHTGQHFDANMSDIFFREMNIPSPKYQLGINARSHGEMTGRMLIDMEVIFKNECPDFVFLYGDTNSTLAGALAGAKLGIKIAHIEAGLRSFNMAMPEEINRILTDRVSSNLYCPTLSAKNNLLNEGYKTMDNAITVTGDVMYDAALHFSKYKTKDKHVIDVIESGKDFVLSTIHRAENTDNEERLRDIFSGLDKISECTTVIMPLHPRTKKCIGEYGIKTNVTFMHPVGYMAMLKLLQHAQIVVTDSGGLQKEAYFFDKYCLTARDETEWVELVDFGYNRIVGADSVKIFETYNLLKDKTISNKKLLYGNGNASEIIVKSILQSELVASEC